MPKCPFCENFVKDFCRGHVIPRGFFEKFKKSKAEKITMFSKGEFRLGSQKGPYWKSWCRSCEDVFKKPDDYVLKLLYQKTPDLEIKNTESISLLIYSFFDYETVLDFGLSLALRGHISDHPFYSSFKLNYENFNMLHKWFFKEKFKLSNVNIFITATSEVDYQLFNDGIKKTNYNQGEILRVWLGKFQFYICLLPLEDLNINWILSKGQPLQIPKIDRSEEIFHTIIKNI